MLILAAASGCGRGKADSESIKTHFEELDGFTAQVKILSDIEQSVLEYGMKYVYNKDGNDTFTITAPESLEGVSGTIAGSGTDGFSLQYDGMSLDDAVPRRPGLTPSDGFFALLADLRNQEPSQVWTENAAGETLTALRYESDVNGVKVEKQVWLSQELQPVCAELFADGDRVLTIQVTGYQNT